MKIYPLILVGVLKRTKITETSSHMKSISNIQSSCQESVLSQGVDNED